jgi:hypothetical protein
MYTRIKMAPPPSAVWLGKRQILPKPTADPAAVAITPIFDTNVLVYQTYLVAFVNSDDGLLNLHSTPSLVSFISTPIAFSSSRIYLMYSSLYFPVPFYGCRNQIHQSLITSLPAMLFDSRAIPILRK